MSRRQHLICPPSSVPSSTRALLSGVQVQDVQISNISELDRALASLGQQPNNGVIVPPASFTNTHSALLIALTAKYRLPTMYAFRGYIAAGGLISYGVDGNDLWA